VQEVKDKIRLCSLCCHIPTWTLPLLLRRGRDRSLICVVEEPNNLLAVEKTREFRGVYHVLHGSLSPCGGSAPRN